MMKEFLLSVWDLIRAILLTAVISVCAMGIMLFTAWVFGMGR